MSILTHVFREHDAAHVFAKSIEWNDTCISDIFHHIGFHSTKYSSHFRDELMSSCCFSLDGDFVESFSLNHIHFITATKG